MEFTVTLSINLKLSMDYGICSVTIVFCCPCTQTQLILSLDVSKSCIFRKIEPGTDDHIEN